MSDSTPTIQPAAFDQEVEHNYRFNFIVNSLDGAFYWFGYSFIAPTIILPLYVSHFTDNPIYIGLISFLGTAGFLLPQLFTSNWVERAPRKKWFPVNLGFFLERLPVFVMAGTCALFAKSSPMLALFSFLLSYAWYTFGAGVIIVGWQDMIAKIIPTDRRGRFFGITNFVGNVAGILGAIAVPYVLNNYPYPQGFIFAFSAAAVLIFISWAWLSQAREPLSKTSKPHVSQLEYFRSLPNVMRQDANFTRYLIFQIVYTISGMASGFLIVYAARRWNMPDSQATIYGILMQVGQAATYLFFGILADRKGHKFVLEISTVINLLSFFLVMAAPSPLWLYPIFFLRGANYAANFITGTSIVMEFTQPENRPTYIGLANTLPGVAGTFAPLLGGWLAKVTGYYWLFMISGLVGAAAFAILRWTVNEPRHLTPISISNGSSTVREMD